MSLTRVLPPICQFYMNYIGINSYAIQTNRHENILKMLFHGFSPQTILFLGAH